MTSRRSGSSSFPAEHDHNQRQWAVAWVWKNELHPPFLVRYWGPLEAFHLARPWKDGDRLSQLSVLRGMAKSTGLPLGVPRAYLDSLGGTEFSGESQPG